MAHRKKSIAHFRDSDRLASPLHWQP